MTSITVPVYDTNRFVGVAGVDISMAFIQELSEKLDTDIFNGQGTVKIYSYHGSMVANTEQPDTVGQLVADSTWNELRSSVQNAQEDVSVTESTIRIMIPMRFQFTEQAWAIEPNLAH